MYYLIILIKIKIISVKVYSLNICRNCAAFFKINMFIKHLQLFLLQKGNLFYACVIVNCDVIVIYNIVL